MSAISKRFGSGYVLRNGNDHSHELIVRCEIKRYREDLHLSQQGALDPNFDPPTMKAFNLTMAGSLPHQNVWVLAREESMTVNASNEPVTRQLGEEPNARRHRVWMLLTAKL